MSDPQEDVKLGILWPDDGSLTLDYELVQIESRMESLRDSRLRVTVAFTKAKKTHTRADLLATGNINELIPPARDLVACGCRALAWACTSGSFIGGFEWARNQAASLEAATGVPITSATLAMIEAAKELAADRVDLLGAYPAEITNQFRQCLMEAGFSVVTVSALNCPTGSDSFHLNIIDAVKHFAIQHPQRDYPLLIPDTAINTLNIHGELGKIAGRDVITANQATLWHGFKLLNRKLALSEIGPLLWDQEDCSPKDG